MTMRINRRRAIGCMLAGTALPLLPGCRESKGASGAGSAKTSPTAAHVKFSSEWEKKAADFDLVDRLSLATLRHRGVFIDFGTTDYFKYTLGKWRTGWGKNLEREGVSFTQAKGATSRVYFPWFEKHEMVLKLRLLPQKAKLASVYINNKPLSKIDFKTKDWQTYSLNVPQGMLTSADNHLLLRWQGDSTIGENEEAAWVDYIHLQEGPLAEVAPLPTQSAVVGKTTLKGKEKLAQALFIYPGFTLSYYMEVPEEKLEPELGFYIKAEATSPESKQDEPTTGPAQLQFSIKAYADRNPEIVLMEERINPQTLKEPSPRAVSLKELAGQVIRLDCSLSTEAAARPSNLLRLVLAKPAVYVKGRNFTSPPAVIRGKNRKVARNSILLVIDTLRADHVACYGALAMKTPVLDRLASEGTLFENFCAVEDWTKPSCATMLTGLYPSYHKAQTEEVVLPKTIKMLPEEMKSRGIATAAFISNGYVSDKFGFKRGWDHYENYIRENKPTEAEHLLAKAADWISKNRDKRFFAYLHTIDPHVPYSPPEEFLRIYDNKPYGGPIKPRMTHLQLEEIKKGKMKVSDRDKERLIALYKGEISYHDRYLGIFMQKMADLGLLEETVIMVTSDHGEEFWEHGSVGHGHSIYQELVHVPMVIFWKGTVPAGQRISETYDHSVIAPTIMDAMGLDLPSYLQGRSVLGPIFGQAEPSPHAGFTTHQDERMGAWSGRLKLQMNGPVNTYLYDLESDPTCQENIAKSRPIALRYMRSLLGIFLGAPDKRQWKGRTLLAENVVDVKAEEIQLDEELKKQLRVLGYIN